MDEIGRKSHVNLRNAFVASPSRVSRAWSLQSCGCLAFVLLVLAPLAAAQTTDTGTFVPLPDPGYGLFYHDTEGAPNAATRWGYHEGWLAGRHDRNHGEVANPQEKGAYASPRKHGSYAGMTQSQYEKLYRIAYLQGYQHGSRL